MNRISKVLKDKGVKQTQLADALGVTRSCISQYCSGKVDVPISKLIAISIALDCDISELIKSNEMKQKSKKRIKA